MNSQKNQLDFSNLLEQERSRLLMKPVDFWHSISLQTSILLAEVKHLTPAPYCNLSSIIIHQRCSGLGFVPHSQVPHRDVVMSEQKHRILHSGHVVYCSHTVFFKTLSDLGSAIYQKPTMTRRSQDLNKFAKDPYRKRQSSGKASTFHIIQIMCSLMAQ